MKITKKLVDHLKNPEICKKCGKSMVYRSWEAYEETVLDGFYCSNPECEDFDEGNF